MVIHDSSTHLQYGASPIPISFHEVIWSPFKNVGGVNKKFAFQLELPPIKPHYFTALSLNLEPQGKYILLLIINNSFRKVGTLFSWTQNSCIVYLYTTLLEIIFSSFLEMSDNYYDIFHVLSCYLVQFCCLYSKHTAEHIAVWDYSFSRRRVWSIEPSGMYCHVVSLE
jgi:hypothetical protein